MVMAGVMRKSRRAGKPLDQPIGIRPPELAQTGESHRDRGRPERVAICALQTLAGAEIGQHFDSESGGSFTIDVIMIEPS